MKIRKFKYKFFFVSLLLLYTTYVLAINTSVVEYGQKSFLVLPEEPPPQNMIWTAYGEEIESYLGIKALSNGAKETNRNYQCTELVHRFLREVYGLPSRIGLGMGHGRDLAHGIANRFYKPVDSNGLVSNHRIHYEYFESGDSKYPPVIGSIISMWFDSKKRGYGHVGVIRSLKPSSNNSVIGYLFDQHGAIHKKVGESIFPDKVIFKKNSAGIWSGKVYSWKYKRYYPVIGWSNVVVVSAQ